MEIPVRKKSFYQFWAWLYAGMGIALIGAGVLLINGASESGPDRSDFLFGLGAVLAIGGSLRLLYSILYLRNMRKRPPISASLIDPPES